MSPAASLYPGISLNRILGKQIGDCLCVVCDVDDQTPTELLEVNLGQYGFYLCPACAAGLLGTLLRNHLRREARRKPVLGIPKDPEDIALISEEPK